MTFLMFLFLNSPQYSKILITVTTELFIQCDYTFQPPEMSKPWFLGFVRPGVQYKQEVLKTNSAWPRFT